MSVEPKGCGNCRWRYASSRSEPCRSCDGYELDKFEFKDWTDEEKAAERTEILKRAGLVPTEEDRQWAREIHKKLFGNEEKGEGMTDEKEQGFREEEPETAGEGKPRYEAAIENMIALQVAKGREKYGVTLEENRTLTAEQRIEHLEEELIDALMYCEHIKALRAGSSMTANDYQRAALRTAQADTLPPGDLMLNGVMGLAGESGECIDIVKKTRFQGHMLDREKLAEELGDVAWYLAITAWAAGYELGDVFERNVEKLKKRYPDGFDKARSMNREA